MLPNAATALAAIPAAAMEQGWSPLYVSPCLSICLHLSLSLYLHIPLYLYISLPPYGEVLHNNKTFMYIL